MVVYLATSSALTREGDALPYALVRHVRSRFERKAIGAAAALRHSVGVAEYLAIAFESVRR